MRAIPQSLAAKLQSGASQYAHIWLVKRQDGVRLGFTNHDRDLIIDGVPCIASTGLEAKDMNSELGLAPGGGDVMGALQAAAIDEADIVAGLYDGAEITTYLCDYEPPFEKVLLDVAIIGEIRRDEIGFIAELRGLTHRLSEATGRLYQKKCDADFGDQRCGIHLARADITHQSMIEAVLAPGNYRLSGLHALPNGAFNQGHLIFEQWPNKRFAIKSHFQMGGAVMIELWSAPQRVEAGARVKAIIGCDKEFKTCTQRFQNSANFRGFPHMPGNEMVLTIVQDGDPGYDGRSLFHG